MNCEEAHQAIWNVLRNGQRRMIQRDPHSPEETKPYPSEVLDHLESCNEGCKEWETRIWNSRIKSGQIAVVFNGQRFEGSPVEVLYQIATKQEGYSNSSPADVIDTLISDKMMGRREDIRDWPNREPEASALKYFRLLKAEGTLGEFLDPDGLLD